MRTKKVSRIAACKKKHRLPHAELVKVRFASNDCSSIFKLLDDMCIVGTLEAAENLGAACCWVIQGAYIILYCNETSVQGTCMIRILALGADMQGTNRCECSCRACLPAFDLVR